MIKTIHLATVAISLGLFLIRGLWMMQGSNLLSRKWVRIVPHINDTVLLISAIILAIQIQQYPFVHAWLTAKVLALIAYIVLGTLALKRGRTKQARTVFWCLALATFAYIVMVARTHNAMWFM